MNCLMVFSFFFVIPTTAFAGSAKSPPLSPTLYLCYSTRSRTVQDHGNGKLPPFSLFCFMLIKSHRMKCFFSMHSEDCTTCMEGNTAADNCSRRRPCVRLLCQRVRDSTKGCAVPRGPVTTVCVPAEPSPPLPSQLLFLPSSYVSPFLTRWRQGEGGDGRGWGVGCLHRDGMVSASPADTHSPARA